MKKLVTKSFGLAIGVALVAPLLMAPAAVNGSLAGFSSNAQGGQNASDWGIPQNSSNQNSSNQNSSSQGHSNQNSQSGDGQSGPAEGQAKSGDADGQSGPAEGQAKSGDAGGQSGPGEGQAKSGDGGNQNGNGGNQNSDGGNQNGAGEGQTKSGDGGNQNNSGSAEGDGPMLNPMGGSIRPDDPRLGGNHDGGNSGGHGSGSGSGSGSHGAHSGQGGPGDYPPLDPPNDGQYDPSNNNGEQQVPSGCAEAGSMCAQCVQRNESVVQFNRRYLHVAWSTTHQAIEYANKAIAFGDAASGIHSTQALAWQLAGKPQITEALTSIRRTYDNKYHIYINNMEEALNALNQCEQDNFAVRDLYARFSSLYLEFVKARYQSPD